MKRIRQMTAWLAVMLMLLSVVPFGASAKTRLYGDLNRDGQCLTTDVRQLMGFVVGQNTLDDEQYMLADYTCDGEINSSDARAVLLAITDGAAAKAFPPTVDDPSMLCAQAYVDAPYVVLQGNIPSFTEAEKRQTQVFERYAPLDELGRCGTAYANLCRELMPTEDRDSLGSVTPSGWHNRQYDHIAGGWLYHRSHIIGFQLAGEQANKRNLITGTRYMNLEGMLPFENMIADYIKETDHHVLYRATPVFVGDRLLAEGVRIEAWSVEDGGEGICFHVFCYNVQPGVEIDYATGENREADSIPDDDSPTQTVYILNTKTKKFHFADCGSAATITAENRQEYIGDRETLIADGYTPCGNCDP